MIGDTLSVIYYRYNAEDPILLYCSIKAGGGSVSRVLSRVRARPMRNIREDKG